MKFKPHISREQKFNAKDVVINVEKTEGTKVVRCKVFAEFVQLFERGISFGSFTKRAHLWCERSNQHSHRQRQRAHGCLGNEGYIQRTNRPVIHSRHVDDLNNKL